MLLPKPSSTTIHRKFPLFWRDLSNLLRQWLDYLQNSKDELQQHSHVYAGDVNTDNERAEPTTLQSLFDHVQAELRVQQLRPFDCTYRKGGAAHSAIDAIGVPLLRQIRCAMELPSRSHFHPSRPYACFLFRRLARGSQHIRYD